TTGMAMAGSLAVGVRPRAVAKAPDTPCVCGLLRLLARHGSQVRDGDVEVGEGEATVDLQRLAGEEAAGRGRQIDCGSGDVDGVTEAAHRGDLLHRCGALLV